MDNTTRRKKRDALAMHIERKEKYINVISDYLYIMLRQAKI